MQSVQAADNDGVARLLGDAARCLEPVDTWQANVHDYQVRSQAMHSLDGVLAALSFSHELKVRDPLDDCPSDTSHWQSRACHSSALVPRVQTDLSQGVLAYHRIWMATVCRICLQRLMMPPKENSPR